MASKEALARAKSMLVGALVADAATMPLHWLYGKDAINNAMGTKAEKPEFFDTPSCPYYSTKEYPGHYALGQGSPYGEELLCLLRHVVKHNGDFTSPESFADDLLVWGETFGGRANHCTKKFVEQRKAGKRFPECGADDSQANCFMKAIVLTARYFGKPELYDKVDEAVRTHQDNDIAVLYAQTVARQLERVILGEDVATVVSKPDANIDHDVVLAYEFTQANKSKSTWDFVDALGTHLKLEKPVFSTSCALPGAFLASMWVLANHQGFESAVRQNIRVGGDNCSRGSFIGALTAAAAGTVPSEWKAKTRDIEEYEKMADILIAARSKE